MVRYIHQEFRLVDCWITLILYSYIGGKYCPINCNIHWLWNLNNLLTSSNSISNRL